MLNANKNIQRLMDGLEQKNKDLVKKMDELDEIIDLRVESEKAYRIALRKNILLEKTKGSVSIASDLAKGSEEVSQAKLEQLKWKEILKACYASIEVMKVNIQSYQSLLKWNGVEFNNQ